MCSSERLDEGGFIRVALRDPVQERHPIASTSGSIRPGRLQHGEDRVGAFGRDFEGRYQVRDHRLRSLPVGFDLGEQEMRVCFMGVEPQGAPGDLARHVVSPLGDARACNPNQQRRFGRAVPLAMVALGQAPSQDQGAFEVALRRQQPNQCLEGHFVVVRLLEDLLEGGDRTRHEPPRLEGQPESAENGLALLVIEVASKIQVLVHGDGSTDIAPAAIDLSQPQIGLDLIRVAANDRSQILLGLVILSRDEMPEGTAKQPLGRPTRSSPASERP